jgi:hypothetical protein
MAFYSGTKTNQNLVFGNKGEIGNLSFASSEAVTIASTENKILASDGASDDYFGFRVTVGNGRIVVGAIGDDDNGSNSGSVYIFDLEGTQLAKITASDGTAADEFGTSVAIGNGRIVVGASGDNSSQGSAYIFDLDGTQLAKITASDGDAGHNFGFSVAVGNGRIVVGAYGDDDNGSSSGSAYIFDLDGTQLAKITASDGAANDNFGYEVTVGSGRIVVSTFNKGSFYIFDLDGTQLAKITASGYSVAVGNGRIVLGNVGVDNLRGAAYIFDLDGTQLANITASDGAAQDRFGTSVAIRNGRIVVGAQSDGDNGYFSGSTYIFDLDGTQLAKITPNDGAASDSFGVSVAIGNGRIVVGALGDNNGQGSAYIYNTNEYYDDYVEKIADNKIGKYTRLTG